MSFKASLRGECAAAALRQFWTAALKAEKTATELAKRYRGNNNPTMYEVFGIFIQLCPAVQFHSEPDSPAVQRRPAAWSKPNVAAYETTADEIRILGDIGVSINWNITTYIPDQGKIWNEKFVDSLEIRRSFCCSPRRSFEIPKAAKIKSLAKFLGRNPCGVQPGTLVPAPIQLSVDSLLRSINCSICLRSFRDPEMIIRDLNSSEETQKIVNSSCGHVFCQDCLADSIATCPTCRQPIGDLYPVKFSAPI